MEFVDLDRVDDGDGCGKALPAVSCTICLDVVTDHGDRSCAKLRCGHRFHLDCIGSAFNAKGAMQCPNCRKIEKGRWLYSNCFRSYDEFNMEDLVHDETSNDPNNSDMTYMVSPLYTRLPSSSNGGVLSSTIYHGLVAHHAVIIEPIPVSSASHRWPYVTYSGSYSSFLHSRGSVSNGSTFSSHLNSQSAPTSSSISGPGQLLFPSTTQRVPRDNIGMPRSASFVSPSAVDHGNNDRAGSSVAAPMPPTPYRDIAARSRERMLALQAYFQNPPANAQGVRTPLIPSAGRSNGHMNMTQGEPGSAFSEQASGVSFPSTSSAGRNVLETENTMPNHFHAREREQYTSFPSSETEREPIWVPYHQLLGAPRNGIRPAYIR